MDGHGGGRDKKQRVERASPRAKPPTATKEGGRSNNKTRQEQKGASREIKQEREGNPRFIKPKTFGG